MADEDNFDIDIYGDLDEPASANYKKEDGEDELILDDLDENNADSKGAAKTEGGAGNSNANGTGEDTNMGDGAGNDGDTKGANPAGGSATETPQRNTMKRKHPDNRPVDSNATTALYVSDLHWWSTDDDIRGWVNQAECEDELKDITFSEHKVNGKSKGVAFVEFATPQAATATKNKIESLASQAGYGSKKHVVTYTSPFNNPFRTLPKDAPARNKGDDSRGGDFKRRDGGDRSHGVGGGGPNFPAPINFQPNNMGGGMGGNMGGGGGFRNNRGGGMMNRGNMGGSGGGGGGGGGGFMGNRGPGGPMGGGGGPGGSPQTGFGMMNQPGSGMFGNNMGGGGGGGGMQFQGGGGGGGGGGGFQGSRGGMNMGMRGGGGGPGNRGGRGGFQGGMNPGNMPMGQMGGGMNSNMAGGNMGGGMGMGGGNMGGPMGGGMGGNMGGGPNQGGDMGGGFNPMMGSGFNPMMGGGPSQFTAPHFNPAFFGQGQQGGGEQGWNPHGAKRPRQDGSN